MLDKNIIILHILELEKKMQDSFQVCFKYNFNAAHFIAHENERETLHGHNYRLKVYLQGFFFITF